MAVQRGDPLPPDLSTEERRAYEQLSNFYAKQVAYAQIMASRFCAEIVITVGPPPNAPNTSSRIGSSEGSSRGYAQGCPLVIHSSLRAGWSCPAAGPGVGPAPN